MGMTAVRLGVLYQLVTFLLTVTVILYQSHRAPPDWYQVRAAMIQDLEQRGGKHLIIVRYGPEHDPIKEWVYNEADIDKANVVWARETPRRQERVDADQLRRLLEYFADRSVWLLDEAASPVVLTNYRTEDGAAR